MLEIVGFGDTSKNGCGEFLERYSGYTMFFRDYLKMVENSIRCGICSVLQNTLSNGQELLKKGVHVIY